MSRAVLVLEDGRVFTGESFGAEGSTTGEAVFSTGMTGYQETLTDPSYHRQVVIMTAPHIGNTGINLEDDESSRIWVSGFVVRDPAKRPSNWRSTGTLDDYLRRWDVVGISGIDTRALTRHLRERGAMRVGIFSGSAAEANVEDLLARVVASDPMEGADLCGQVSTRVPYTVPAEGEERFRVVSLDLGIKAQTPRNMARRGITSIVVPSDSTIDDILAHAPDGVFLSNGPGDPATAVRTIETLRGLLDQRVPLFGICFGHQLLGRALGLSTYKLKYGHRGINQPVIDRQTGHVEITAHNHGFAVAAPSGDALHDPGFETAWGRAEVTHVCLNDNVVEGLRLVDQPAFSVQYHPEAAAGPHDAQYLFDRFVQMLEGQRAQA
jgi:carbamoyl-phosphate synthase small subunit